MLVDLYLQGRLPLDRFVSATGSLSDVEAAFLKMEAGRCCARSSSCNEHTGMYRSTTCRR